MLKPAIIVTAIVAVAGSSIVFAQQKPGGSSGPDQRSEHHYQPSAADMAAFTDARIAALRAGLELTPDQAKNWPAFEQALREAAQLRMKAREARIEERQAPEQGQASADPFARLDQRADNLAKMSAALKTVAEAGTALYQSLTDAQKQRFPMLARMLRPRMGGGMMGHGMMGHGMMGGGGMMGRGMMGRGMMGHGRTGGGMMGDEGSQD